MATNIDKTNDADALKKTNDTFGRAGVEIEGAEMVEDLEKKFKEISGEASSTQSTQAIQKTAGLQSKLEELEQIKIKVDGNLTVLKDKVKKDLDNLKNIKEQVENELSKIKDLEKIKEKINAEIIKIQELEKNEQSIEEEVKALEEEVKI
jgi:DNA repair exonuclease SbcCD ATPase subunit